MSSLWYKLKYSIQSELNNLVEHQPTENPLASLNQYLKEAEQQTKSVGALLKRQHTLTTELKSELIEAEKMREKRQAQYELAVKTEEDDLIAFAQAEVQAYTERVHQLTINIAEATAEHISLERKFEEMKHKLKDMKLRQLQLMGKENVSKAHHHMNKVLTPEQNDNPLASFSEMSSYIDNLGNSNDNSIAYDASMMEKRLAALGETNTTEQEFMVK